MKTFTILALLTVSASAQQMESPATFDSPGPGYREQRARILNPEAQESLLPKGSTTAPVSKNGPSTIGINLPLTFGTSPAPLNSGNPFGAPIGLRMDGVMGVSSDAAVKIGSGTFTPTPPVLPKAGK